jgi:O-antigen ligase
MAGVFSLLGYILVFFGLRELGQRFQDRPWIPVLPLIVLGALESAIGMTGLSDNGLGGPDQISGTYTNRDHFSGMLEMIFPLAVMCGWAMLRANLKAAIWVCLMWGMGVLIFAGILASQSKMGFLAGVASFLVICALSLGPQVSSRKWRLTLAGLMVSAALLLLVFLPTAELMERFGDMSGPKGLSGDTRVYLAKGTISLIGEFPWFGIGGGAFESTFMKYQRESHMFRMQMAHNDYLQYLAELGIFGFAVVVAAGVSVLIPLARGIVRESDERRRLLSVGCAGSLVAIGLHSLADFNLHIQANAMILGWIIGVASGNTASYRANSSNYLSRG